MDRPYDDIPRQGKHLGANVDEEPTTSVRAQEAAKPRADEPSPVYLYTQSEAEGHYRIQRWEKESDVDPGTGYREINRIPEGGALSDLIEGPSEGPRYIVFENLQTGDVYFDRESELSDNWTGDGRFDQVTIFDDEESAEAYVSKRQK